MTDRLSMRASRLLAVLCVLGAPRLISQGHKPKDVAVHSCPAADSLIGPMHDNGNVRETYDGSAGATTLSTPVHVTRGQFTFSAALWFQGRGPVSFPAPNLSFVVGDTKRAQDLLHATQHPNLALVVDDTLRIDLGPVAFGSYRGPDFLAQAPLTVSTLPTWALALARAGHAGVMVDSMTFRISDWELQDYRALYRVAVCNTLPAR
jgi:hypothetical protein